MAKKSEKDKRRDRLEKERLKLKKQLEQDDALLDSGAELLEEEIAAPDNPEEDVVEKDMGGMVAEPVNAYGGPTSWEEIDALKQAREKNNKIQDAAYTVQQLVSNIVYHPALSANEKSEARKKAGGEFGVRVTDIVDEPIEKALDVDLLEVEAIIAKDLRATPVAERIGNWISKAVLTSAAEEKLSDSDFHDKAHVRNALARAAQMMKKGGEAAADAKAAMPKIRAAAKRMGIGMQKENGILIEKDASNSWRWVGWPTNNFIDHSNEIITEAAHLDYVDWINKDIANNSPVFTSCHAPGTARTYPVDFAAYENGFVVMSGQLTEPEAAALLKVSAKCNVGMSHTGWGLRDPDNQNHVIKYRSFEVTDLPVEIADNPYTFMELSKEVDMDQLQYLTELLGSKEKAERALKLKTSMKQSELREAGVESKEKIEVDAPAAPVIPAPADKDAIVAQVLKELDVDGLQEFLAKSQEALDKVPVLEELVKDLSTDREEWLAEKIAPRAEKKFLWSKARASADDKTVIKEGDEEDEELKTTVARLPENWLADTLGVEPLVIQ